MDIYEYRFNALIWAVWGQGTRRLVTERPNGDRVDDPIERQWRMEALSPVRADPCPHWAAYRARAVPIVTEAARQVFAGQSDEDAPQLLFQQVQTQPWVGMRTIGQVARHADLDMIIEADVWPWLEQKWAAAQPLSPRNEAEPVAAASTSAPPASSVVDYRSQITPLAQLAYQLHTLGTQISYIADREAGAATATLDTAATAALTGCGSILANHCAYIRRCAVNLQRLALRNDKITQLFYGRPAQDTGGDHQWWTDLTTRPITSVVRDEVANAKTADATAAVLLRLADESDGLLCELGDAFENVGWNRGIVSGAAVGSQLRQVARGLRAGGDPGEDQRPAEYHT